MAKAYKCDRCGCLYEQPSHDSATKIEHIYLDTIQIREGLNPPITKDLCIDCAHSFIQWYFNLGI